jgi:hypothetical protein
MLDPDIVWRQEFATLPTTSDPSWAANMADMLEKLTNGKLTVSGLIPESTFTFQKAVFQSIAVTAVPAPLPAGVIIITNAFLSAVSASTMFINAGTSIGAPTPATTFAAPPSVTIDAVAASELLRAQLLAALPVPDALASTVPSAFRSAFLAVLVSAVGINTVPPPGGPSPLILPPTPLA